MLRFRPYLPILVRESLHYCLAKKKKNKNAKAARVPARKEKRKKRPTNDEPGPNSPTHSLPITYS